MNTTSETLRRTPLHRFHVDNGAKMVPFAGWEMPLHYGSIIEEHHQVRSSGGLFDVSHMGRLRVVGRDACRFLDRLCTRQVAGMQNGQARYALVCNEEGGCRDDVLVYRLDEGEYMIVCNAANRTKILDHIDQVREDHVFSLEDITESSVMLALQGPDVMSIIGHYSEAIPALKRYRFVTRSVLGLEMLVSRTGYTGEDGVEVIFRMDSILAGTALKMLVKELTSAGDRIRPVGLGARDSLRLEAAMALYGHEITETVDPLSAGLRFAVKLDKGADDPDVGSFIGQEALQKIDREGGPRRLVGLRLETRRAARQEMSVVDGDNTIGVVTSGVLSPTLDQSIAMAYVDTEAADTGAAVSVDLGRQVAEAVVVDLPFYKR